MNMAKHIINEESVQKIFLAHPTHPSEKVMLLVLTDTYVVNVELEDYSSMGRSEVWIKDAKIWDKKHAPSLYDLEDLLSRDGEIDLILETYPSLDSYKELDIVALLKEITYDGKTLILPTEEAAMYMDSPIERPVRLQNPSDDVPF